jgi:hypothetical protein
MKLNKEYIILGLIILALTGYLVFRHTDRMHYRLPELKKVESKDISKIEITRGSDTTVITRKDDAWYIGPQGWQADPEKIKSILSALSELKITDLVSESRAYDRYDLDAKKKILVKSFAGTALKRELIVGKSASTSRHTFVMLPGDEKVYLADGDFRSLLDAAPSGLRDTVVLSFNQSEITEIHIEANGQALSLTRQDIPAKTEKPSANISPDQVWKNDKGEQLDKVKVATLLAGLSKVYCESYLDDSVKSSLTKPLYSFKLKGTKEYSISLFEKNGNKTPALSSGSPSPFVLPDFKLDGLKQSVKDLEGKRDGK